MHLWKLGMTIGEVHVGSATTVENRGTKLQSVGVAVKHHTPTKDKYQQTNPRP